MNQDQIQQVIDSAKAELQTISSDHELNVIKSKYLGKNSQLQQDLQSLGKLEPAKRAEAGRTLNVLKQQLEQLFKQALPDTKGLAPIEISQPGQTPKEAQIGHMHPSSLVLEETYQVFSELGFAVVDSPEIETDWFNFEALNMPESHPAREMQDTFYIKGSNMQQLPRTHTSGMQIRFMLDNKPPFKIIVPGKVFRSENEDATHSWSFNQVEGLVVGEGVSVADLKGTLLQIVKKQLGEDTEIRFRPSYFPYTEPSVEVDAKYKGKWLELGGAGMVHPDVLRNGKIDPEKYSGFAFGWGIERLAVIKYGLNDLRLLWRPNLNYLEQF